MSFAILNPLGTDRLQAYLDDTGDNYHINNSLRDNYPRYDPIRENYPQVPNRENYTQSNPIRDNYPRYDPLRNTYPGYDPIQDNRPKYDHVRENHPQYDPIRGNYPQITSMRDNYPQNNPMRDIYPQNNHILYNYPRTEPIRDNSSQANPVDDKYPGKDPINDIYPHPVQGNRNNSNFRSELVKDAINSNTHESPNLSQSEIVQSNNFNVNSIASGNIAYKSKVLGPNNPSTATENSSSEAPVENSKNLDNTGPINSMKSNSNEINKEKECNNLNENEQTLTSHVSAGKSKKLENSKVSKSKKLKSVSNKKKKENSKNSDSNASNNSDSNSKKKDNDYFNEALQYANNILKKKLSKPDKSLDTTCDICNKVLAHKACMKAHKRTHTGKDLS